MQNGEGTVSRRLFIQLGAGTGAGVLLAACSTAPPTAAPTSAPAAAPTTAPAAAPTTAVAAAPATPAAAATSAPAAAGPAPTVIGAAASGKNTSALPNYIPPNLLAKPDYDAHDPRVTLGWDNFPQNAPQSWNKPAPGTGSTVNAFAVDYYPPPTPLQDNPTWQAVNKALNSDFQMTQVTGTDYPLRMATLMAGNDIPDILHIYFGLTGPFVPPGTAEFIKAKCQDLTKFLAGDAIKDYPNLAAIPTYAWTNSSCVIDGVLYSWPIHRYLGGLQYFFKNTDMWNEKIGASTTAPKDAADLKKMITELNDPNNGVWGFGGQLSGRNMGVYAFAMMYGAPNAWGLDGSGKVVRDRETDQFKAAVSYVRDLWTSGLYWPDAPTSTDQRSNFVGKKFALCQEGFGNSWNDFWLRGLQQNPQTNFDIILPFSADANTKVLSYITGGYISTNVMKKASDDRVKELLRIVDYLAKPFGTQEDLLITYGLAPADYTIGSDGNPNLTSDGKGRSQYVPWQYISDRPYATYYAGIPNYAKHVNDVEKAIVDPKIAVADVTLGYYSPTAFASAGKQAEQAFSDGLNNILVARDPVSNLDQLVKDWQNSAGNKIKQEYNDAMAAAA